MGKEIERKFLVDISELDLSKADASYHYVQAYLSTDPGATVRLRLIDGNKACLTVKGRNKGAVRDEWEYPIPPADAEAMFARLDVKSLIDKTRYRFGRWEVDLFHGNLDGLIVAEIELSSSDEAFERPAFIGEEVTDDPRYYNSALGASQAVPRSLHEPCAETCRPAEQQ